MELKESFQEIYNFSHPHIENIDEDVLYNIVIKIFATLTKALDSEEIELPYIKNLLDSLGLSIKDGSKVVLLEDDRLKYDNYDYEDDILTDTWKSTTLLLRKSINCELNWNDDGYFYIRDNEFMNNCVKVISKSDIFEILSSDLNVDLEKLVQEFQVSSMTKDESYVIEKIIKKYSDDNDISKFFKIDNPTISNTISYAAYSLKKALEAID